MSVYPHQTGPCSCLGTTVEDCLEPCSCVVDECSGCLRLSHPVIQFNDSVGPCNESGAVLVGQSNDYSICNDNVQHIIVDYDKTAFSQVSIDDEGVIRFITKETAVEKQYYHITYKVYCKTQVYAAFGQVMVGIRDMCINLPAGYDCDRCTGELTAQSSDLEVTITEGIAVSDLEITKEYVQQ